MFRADCSKLAKPGSLLFSGRSSKNYTVYVSSVFHSMRFTSSSTHSQLALALIEHETLDTEEVEKVIRGEPIRNIKDVIGEDLSRIDTTTTEVPSAAAAS
jgi:hypothetical protein